MSLKKSPSFVLVSSVGDVKTGEDHIYRFKSFRLNVGERQLFHKASPIPLTPKTFDVLALLVENSGHLVGKDELLEAVWADSFVEEQNVTRAIHTLRRALGEDENGDKFIETVAKKGYRFVAEVSEVFETEEPKPEDLSGSRDPAIVSYAFPGAELVEPVAAVDPVTSISAESASTFSEPKIRTRTILFSVGFLTAVFLLVLLSFNFRSDPAKGPNKAISIAVLPVMAVNTAQRDEVFEMGIADSVIHRLGSMKGFTVRPLSTIRKNADLAQDPIAVGREQKVDYVLASNYQIAEGRFRITSQLFNVATGQVVETYKSEKDTAGLFALQDAIAGDIGSKLMALFGAVGTTPKTKWGTNNEEAYRLYLQGRVLTTLVNAQSQKKAIGYFEQALALDPNYALPYARMANAYHRLDLLNHEIPRFERISEIVNKAFELDPDLAEAYVARGQLHLAYEWDLPAAERDFIKAIELEPNNDTAHWLNALLLAARKHFDEALREIEIAQMIDPSAMQYMMHRGRILYYARRYDEAVVQFERMLDLDQDSFSNWMMFAYQMKGDDTKAFDIFIKLQERWKSDNIEVYRNIYETLGWQAVRRKDLEFAKLENDGLSRNPFNVAKECALLGEKDQAFEYLNKAVANRKWLIYNLDVEPAFDPLRDDPRFDDLLKRVGLK